jgi:hypothetical protein
MWRGDIEDNATLLGKHVNQTMILTPFKSGHFCHQNRPLADRNKIGFT